LGHLSENFSNNVTNADTVTIDLAAGMVINENTGQTLQAEPLSEYVIKIIKSGGIASLIKKEYADK